MSVVAVPRAERVRYTAAMRAVHWATALLLIGSYATAWTISGTTTNEDLQRLSLMHRSFGVVILGLTAARFVYAGDQMPPLPKDVAKIQRVAARLNVLALYILLLLQPLLGVAASMLHGDKIRLPVGVVVPDLVPVNRSLAHTLFEAHGSVALLLLGLIGMHAVAALYHYFIRRDDVLTRMLPGVHSSPHPGSPGRSFTPL